MGVRLAIAGGIIVDAVAQMDRFPKTTCPGAIGALRMLIGMPAEAPSLALSAAERSGQCTHLIDLARLGLGWLAREGSAKTVEVSLTDRDSAGLQHLQVAVNGKAALVWQLQDEVLVQPKEHCGRSLFGGFTAWVCAQFPPELADLWRIAQLAVFVGRGRAYIVDGPRPRRVAEEPSRRGACHSYSGSAFDAAFDNQGYVHDMSGGLPPFREAASVSARNGA